MSRDRHRRIREAHGRPSLHHRQGPVRRRRQSSRPGATPTSCARRRPMRASRASTRPARSPRLGWLAVFTGADLEADKIGGLICGWMIHSKDGSADEGRPAPGAGAGQGALRRRPRRGRHRRHLCAGARRGREDRGRLWRPARQRRDKRRRRAAPRCTTPRPTTLVYAWHLGDKAATDAAFSRAAHTSPRSTSATTGSSPTRWSRARRSATTTPAPRASPSTRRARTRIVARLVLSAFIGIAPEHKLRVVAPDVGGGFGSKIFIYAEETVCVWAAKKIGRPVKWNS